MFASDEILDRKTQAEIDASPELRKNYEFARSFLERHANKEEIPGILNGIDFSKPVEVVKIPQGEVLQRYGFLANSDSLQPDGRYFTKLGTPEEKLGLKDISAQTESTKHKDFFIVTKDIEALKSTASNYAKPTKGFNSAGVIYEGGGSQYFVSKPQLDSLERFVHPSHKRTNTAIVDVVQTQKDKISHKAESAKNLGPKRDLGTKRIGPKKSQ